MMAQNEDVVWKSNALVEQSDENEDIWDDTALIKAYDKAVALIKGGNDVIDVDNGDSVEGGSDTPTSKRKKKKLAKAAAAATNAQTKPRDSYRWKVGDKCLALFSEDHLYYEATILTLNDLRYVASVRFDTYNNYEEVDISVLLPVTESKRMEFAQPVNNFAPNFATNFAPNFMPQAANVNEGRSFRGDRSSNSRDFRSRNSRDQQPRDRQPRPTHRSKERPREKSYSGHGWNVSDLCYIADHRGMYQQVVINSFITSKKCRVTIIETGQRREVTTNQLQATVKLPPRKKQADSPKEKVDDQMKWPTAPPPPPLAAVLPTVPPMFDFARSADMRGLPLLGDTSKQRDSRPRSRHEEKHNPTARRSSSTRQSPSARRSSSPQARRSTPPPTRRSLPPPPMGISPPHQLPPFGHHGTNFTNNLPFDFPPAAAMGLDPNRKLPFPPPPPMLSGLHGNEEELANMLMSWYMNGYHTGYYQGVQHGKAKKKKSRFTDRYPDGPQSDMDISQHGSANES